MNVSTTELRKNLPNALTVLRILAAPFLLFFVKRHAYGAAAVVFFVSSWTDFLDGQIARRFRAITPLGTLLDPVADKLFVLFAYLAMWGDFKLLPTLVIGRDVAIVLGVALARVLHLDLPIKPLMVSKVNTAFAMLFPFVWVLVKLVAHGSPTDQTLASFLMASGLAMVTTISALGFVKRKRPRSVRSILPLAAMGFLAAFGFWICPPVMKVLKPLLCPELLTCLAGIVMTTTVASGVAYALVFLRAWRAHPKE